jgi:hypothetical protein
MVYPSGVVENDTERNTARYTVTEAADMLGISAGAVRNRLSRGTLAKVKEGGTVYALLPADMSRTTTAIPTDMSQSASDALISEMRERITSLERQLEQERQANSEHRRLLAAALERIPPQLEPSEAPERDAPTDAPTEAPEGSQESVQRPWWRRWFGL